ncbi:hypothetical protein Avbf_15013 [Armadillidium vulgare]|nr:hypothetical protein Avbf_15013 [Armadillidium vulgare]
MKLGSIMVLKNVLLFPLWEVRENFMELPLFPNNVRQFQTYANPIEATAQIPTYVYQMEEEVALARAQIQKQTKMTVPIFNIKK